MEYKETMDPLTRDRIITVVLREEDFVVNNLFDEFDRLLLEECEKSNSVADKILALETVVRRYEQSKLLKNNK
jgi:hypothetical protein